MINIKNRINRVESRIRANIPVVRHTPVQTLVHIANHVLDNHPHWRTAGPHDLPPQEYVQAQHMLAAAAMDWAQMRYWQERSQPLPEVTIDEINARIKELLRDARERKEATL